MSLTVPQKMRKLEALRKKIQAHEDKDVSDKQFNKWRQQLYKMQMEEQRLLKAINTAHHHSRKNPIPKGKWIKATKVKLNRNGTVSVMVSGSAKRRKARR